MGGFTTTALSGQQGTSAGGLRPPQWRNPQLTSITANLPVSGDATGSTQAKTFYFDAVIRADHFQELRSTEHPIQSGASIVDHSYLMPARLILEIGMSDVMASYDPGAYTSGNSKSVSAYQQMLDLQELRIPIAVTTRMRNYSNMVIESIRASDDVRSLHGARFALYLKEIIVASVSTNTQSVRPQTSATSTIGTVQPQPVPDDLLPYLDPLTGTWSSNKPTN